MVESRNAAIERIDGREAGSEKMPVMLTVNDVARMLKCSSRHVWRLSDAGRMPRPCKVGALCRWEQTTVKQWIADGCPNCRKEVDYENL